MQSGNSLLGCMQGCDSHVGNIGLVVSSRFLLDNTASKPAYSVSNAAINLA